MNKKIPVSLAIAIAIVAMTITFSITMILSMKMFDSTVSSVKEKETMYSKIAEIDKSVRDNFYGDIDNQQLYDTMGAGYLAGLGDKYAKYYTAAQYATYQNLAAGKLMGIGVDIVKDTSGYARILAVYENSAAYEAGITANTYLTKVNDIDTKTLSVDAIRSLLQGEEGTVVKVTTMSQDFTVENALELSRRTYVVPSVSGEVVNTTGYIKISAFNTNTPAEFDAKLQSLLNSGITGLVLDVRNNSSTDIESTVRVLDLLCDKAAIGSAVYKSGDSESLGRTQDEAKVDLPIVLVTNASTAGTSELFCVTLRDLNGAKIVGVKTAGKASIQTIVEQTDGSALEFTVAKMVPANSDSSFDGVGVTPDFEIALTAAQETGYYDLTTQDDPQILKAFEMVNILTGASTAEGVSDTTTESEGTVEGETGEEGEAPSDETSSAAEETSSADAG